MDKSEISSMLADIASYERGYKQQMFSGAAGLISVLSDEKWNELCEKRNFTSLPGVGKSINESILEALDTGFISRLTNHINSNEEKFPDFS